MEPSDTLCTSKSLFDFLQPCFSNGVPHLVMVDLGTYDNLFLLIITVDMGLFTRVRLATRNCKTSKKNAIGWEIGLC